MIPEKLVNCKVYKDGTSQLLGVASVDLPGFESMTETLKGAGIAGEIDQPTIGHFSSQVCTINWRTYNKKALKLLAPVTHVLDIRGSLQFYDNESGEITTIASRVVVRGAAKSSSLGKFDPGTPTEGTTEIECVAIQVWVGADEVVHLDKPNMIFKVDGVDYLQKVRQDTGA